MIKKYEIINDGGVKRIKALRSFHVQGRYVNIGDVGGIVYDENTLSQEGNGWIFSGNLNYPSIHVSGDSIVDTNGYEADVTDPRPFVNITGTSALIGAHDFVTGATAAKTLAVSDVEQGSATSLSGSTYEDSKTSDANVIRLKSVFYAGRKAGSVTAGEGYQVRALYYDANKRLVDNSVWGTSVPIASAMYVAILIRKTPDAAIVPADITAANVTLPFVAIESYLDINDSRVGFQYTTAMTVATKVNLANTTLIDVYKSVIDGSNLTISKTGNGAFTANILAEVVKCNVEFRAVSNNSLLIGNFSNVDKIINDGSYSFAVSNSAKNKINVGDCYVFTQSETILPTSAIDAAPTNMPFIFTRCNVPNGLFYHNAKVKNIYTDIDFAKAGVDLGKTISGTNYKLASSEVEGMYRIYDTVGNAYGCLVEAYDSVAGLTSMGLASYNTTIYKDAYVRGKFDFAGTNVFGNKVPGHPRAQVLNVQPRAVQGDFNTVSQGGTITSATGVANRVCLLEAFRINGPRGILVSGAPAGVEVSAVFVSITDTVVSASGWASTPWTPSPVAFAYKAAYLRFRKSDDSPITPEDLAGVTVTVYNGCKIINTGSAAINMKGNIRVEDNATLVNASVTGTGYFGDNSVVYYNPTVWASLDLTGTVYMKDKAVFAPTALTGACALIHMEGNAKFIGSVTRPSTELSFIMGNNAIIEGISNTRSGVVMSGNSKVTATGQIAAGCRGVLVMKDNASIEAVTTVIGAITLAGNYKGNVVKTWIGKRTITDVNAPEYDDNVKTEYDF